MAHLSLHETVEAPAAAVWELLGDMKQGSRWPAVKRCDIEGAGVGCRRTMHLVDGAVIGTR